ncbi:MAG: hypothetical protein AB8G96_13070 [Phycisphaerales bacterium]
MSRRNLPSAGFARTTARTTAHIATLGVLLLAGWVGPGCAVLRPMATGGPDVAADPVAVDVATVERMFDVHRVRSERLSRLRAQGNVVMSWTNAAGAREEMSDLGVTVYRDGAERVFAEVFETSVSLFYAGSDGRWVYFWNRGFAGEPSRFCGWSALTREPPPCAAIVPLIDRPRLLADMLFGVLPIPENAAETCLINDAGTAVRLELVVGGEPLRVTWDVASGMVRQISLLGANGRAVLTANHQGEVPLRVPGVSDFQSPQLPGQVSVSDAAGSFSLRFTFDAEQRPVETVAAGRWGTLFDGVASARSRQGRVDEFQVDPALQVEIDVAPAGSDW